MWIEVNAPSDTEPQDLYAALRAAGWHEQGAPVSPLPRWDAAKHAPAPGFVQERSFFKDGSGPFKSWSKAELTANVRDARVILGSFSFARVPHWRKTVADLL
jgi:hypothetical protein